MSKKEKVKKKEKKILIKKLNISDNFKSSCCEKYKKSENKRCARCPMYDLLKKIEDYRNHQSNKLELQKEERSCKGGTMRRVDLQEEMGSCPQGRGITDTYPAAQMGLKEGTCCSLRIILILRFQRAQTL